MKRLTCRAQDPTTCRYHGTFVEFHRGVRRDGLHGESLEDYAEATLQFKNSLTDAQQDAFRAYTATGYREINAYLRGGDDGLRDQLMRDGDDPYSGYFEKDFAAVLKSCKRQIKLLDEGFAKFNKQSDDNSRVLFKAFRVRSKNGGTVTTPEEISTYVEQHYQVGKIFENKAYTSTSLDSDYMLAHARRNPSQIIVHEIISKHGVPLHEPMKGSVQAAEREVLLPRDIKLEVVGIRRATFEASGHAPSLTGWGGFVPNKKRYTVIQFREV
jgi:hypothetical protein